MGVAIKTECVREINRLALGSIERFDRSANPKSRVKILVDWLIRAARRVKSSQNKTKNDEIGLHLKSLLLDGFGSGPKRRQKNTLDPGEQWCRSF